MADHSKIEWTDATWNVWTGCTKVSPGCANCYIARTPPLRITGAKFVRGRIPLIFYADRLTLPLRWRRPRRIFVGSLSDFFHEDVSDDLRDQMMAVMALTPRHTYQILTKRADAAQKYFSLPGRHTIWWTVQEKLQRANPKLLKKHPLGGSLPPKINTEFPLPNVWIGASGENQRMADARFGTLSQIPAAIRFVSIEPMLGPVDLTQIQFGWRYENGKREPKRVDMLRSHTNFFPEYDVDVPRIDWVICGFESGPRRRPYKLEWARELRDQCAAAGVPFFMKQIDQVTPIPEDLRVFQFPGARVAGKEKEKA